MKSSFFDDPASNAFCYYQIDAERGLRTEVYEGQVVLHDLQSMFRTMVSDPLWSSGHHSLIDLRAADLQLTANEVLRLALMQRQDAFYSRGWRVYVVSSTSDFGTIRMLGKWARTTDQSRIFQTRKAAEDWLENHGRTHPPVHSNGHRVAWPQKAAVAPLRRIG